MSRSRLTQSVRNRPVGKQRRGLSEPRGLASPELDPLDQRIVVEHESGDLKGLYQRLTVSQSQSVTLTLLVLS